MKALILAAGKGKRMMPFTLMRPKPMIPVANRPIIQHNIDSLEGLVDEVVIVVGYLKDRMMGHLGHSYKGMKVTYVVQDEQKGTAHAVLSAEDHMDGRFIVMCGDDIYHRDDIARCAKHRYCALAKEVKDPRRFGIYTLKDGKVVDLVEKPEEPSTNLANTGLYVLDEKIFDTLHSVKESGRGEYELTDAIRMLSKGSDVYCEKVEHHWIPVGYPHDILGANHELVKEGLKGGRGIISDSAEIEEDAVIKGDVSIGEGTVIKSGTYIEGPCMIGSGCVIGPNAYIRGGTSIGNVCHVGASVELKNTVLMDNSNVPHLSYIGDSVIGSHVNLGAGTKCANLRHDNGDIKITVNGGKRIPSGRRKLGCLIADCCKTGISTLIEPGIMMGPFSWTSCGEKVSRNILPVRMVHDGGKAEVLNEDYFLRQIKGDVSLNELLDRVAGKDHIHY